MLGNFLWTKLQKSSPLRYSYRVSYRVSPCECYFKPQTREFLGALEFWVDVDELFMEEVLEKDSQVLELLRREANGLLAEVLS